MAGRRVRKALGRIAAHLQAFASSPLSDLMALFAEEISSEMVLREGLGTMGRIRLFSPSRYVLDIPVANTFGQRVVP